MISNKVLNLGVLWANAAWGEPAGLLAGTAAAAAAAAGAVNGFAGCWAKHTCSINIALLFSELCGLLWCSRVWA
jgi:hypothetical protein